MKPIECENKIGGLEIKFKAISKESTRKSVITVLVCGDLAPLWIRLKFSQNKSPTNSFTEFAINTICEHISCDLRMLLQNP
jgi:hypothetical protein